MLAVVFVCENYALTNSHFHFFACPQNAINAEVASQRDADADSGHPFAWDKFHRLSGECSTIDFH
jgi:hypothetical protein